jgi:hypothetical protein
LGRAGGLQREGIGPAGGGGFWHRQVIVGDQIGPIWAPERAVAAGRRRNCCGHATSRKTGPGSPIRRPAAQVGESGRVVSLTAAEAVSNRRPGLEAQPIGRVPGLAAGPGQPMHQLSSGSGVGLHHHGGAGPGDPLQLFDGGQGDALGCRDQQIRRSVAQQHGPGLAAPPPAAFRWA